MKFKNSFNIKYDIGNQDIVNKYYATSSHSELLKAVLKGANNTATLNAHIAFGAYGTGKSYLSSIIAMLLSKKIDSKHLTKLSKYFETVDFEVCNLLEKSSLPTRKYIPVVLNGFEGPIDSAYNDRLFAALNNANVSVFFPGLSTEIIRIVKQWEESYPTAYEALVEYVQTLGFDIVDFLMEVSNNNKDLHKEFSMFYERFTYGAKLSIENTQDAVTVYENVARQLEEKGYGILLIHDEYGRYLEQLDQDSIRPFMAKMQNMAELANSGVSNLSLLFVAHKPIAQYFGSFDESIKNEFAKIEKRFGIYSIKNDYATFIKITTKFLKDIKREPTQDYIHFAKTGLQKYKVFNTFLSDLEITSGIVEGCYPLHPLTVFLLPQLSRVFGQNERTLFTFLSDIDFENLDRDAFYPSQLVDYFFLGADKKHLDTKENRVFLENLGNIPNYFDLADLELAINVYKMIFIWSITDSNNYSLLSKGLIGFGLKTSVDDVERILQKLANLKMVRYSVNKKNWEIIEVAPIDLDEEISKNALLIDTSKVTQLKLLNDDNPYQILFSKQYNERNEITRFAQITLLTDSSQHEAFSLKKSDLDIPVLVTADKKIVAEEIFKGKYLFDYSDIESTIVRLLSINDLEKKNATIKMYPNILTDLQYEKEMTALQLKQFYDGLCSRKLHLRIQENQISPTSKGELEEFVNDIISSRFSLSPKLINDQINMFIISKTQENAIIRVLDLIVSKGKFNVLHELGDGFKPEHLIVNSIMKMNTDVLQDKFEEYLKQKPSGHFYKLLEVMESEPFGLRPYVAILVLFKLLMPYWKNIMLSTNDNFISDISGKELFQTLQLKNEGLMYSYDNFEFENAEYLEAIETHFPKISEMTLNKSLTIRVCSRMHAWFISLPLIVQQEEELGFQEKQLIKIIKSMKIEPQKAVYTLIKMYEIDDLLSIKQRIDNHFSVYLEQFQTRVYQKYNIEDAEQWLKTIDPIMLKNNMFAQVIAQNLRFIETYQSAVENLDVTLWPVSTFHMLGVTIDSDYRRLFSDVKRSKVVVDGVEKYVEEVDLGKKAQNMKRTLKAMLDANAKYVSKAEVEKVLLELVNEYI